MISFLAEIALGYLLPVAGKAIAKWADRIPKSASNAQFLAAYALLDESRTTSLLTAGTKMGTESLKNQYKNLSKITKTDAFIEKMK